MASGAGIVRVRPTGLGSLPQSNRYQYQVSGFSPSTSTWTECPSFGLASSVPSRTTFFIPSSVATCHLDCGTVRKHVYKVRTRRIVRPLPRNDPGRHSRSFALPVGRSARLGGRSGAALAAHPEGVMRHVLAVGTQDQIVPPRRREL